MAKKMKSKKNTKTSSQTKKSSTVKRKPKMGISTRIKKTSKKMVDSVLTRMPAHVQEKINNLIHVLESGKMQGEADLNMLAGKILLRAQEISKNLRKNKKTK